MVSVYKFKKILYVSMPFFMRSGLTSSDSPMLDFYSILMKQFFPQKIFFHLLNVTTSDTDEI